MSEQPESEPDVVDPGRFELTEPEYEVFEKGEPNVAQTRDEVDGSSDR
ncbi:hypothetical protein AB4Y78_04855 [Janibacter sp. RAF52]